MPSQQQILDYLVLVPGALQKGHPIQRIEGNFDAAARSMDQLHEQFPEHDVILYEVGRREIAKLRGKKPDPKCPRGCTGTRDGRPVVVRTHNEIIQCSICGYLGV